MQKGCLARRANRPLGWLGRIFVAATGPAPATYLPERPAQARAPDYEGVQITVTSRKASTSVSPTANTASPPIRLCCLLVLRHASAPAQQVKDENH
jgi:hypothetical protein